MATNWLRAELADGFQHLLCLRLPATPPADAIEATLAVWLKAVSAGRHWVHEDAVRVSEAFVTLARTCERWPTPREFLQVLPARELPPALPRPVYPRAKAKANITRLREIVSGITQEIPQPRERQPDDACTCKAKGVCDVCRWWAGVLTDVEAS